MQVEQLPGQVADEPVGVVRLQDHLHDVPDRPLGEQHQLGRGRGADRLADRLDDGPCLHCPGAALLIAEVRARPQPRGRSPPATGTDLPTRGSPPGGPPEQRRGGARRPCRRSPGGPRGRPCRSACRGRQDRGAESVDSWRMLAAHRLATVLGGHRHLQVRPTLRPPRSECWSHSYGCRDEPAIASTQRA